MDSGFLNSENCTLFIYLPVLKLEWQVSVTRQLTLKQLAFLFCERFAWLNAFCPLYFYDVCHQAYLNPERSLEELKLPSGVLLYLL